MLAVVAGHAIAAPRLHATWAAGRLPFLGGFMDLAAVYNPLYNVIQSVNLPLFAFISGLLLGKKPGTSTRQLVIRRFKSLMIPYIVWTLLESLRPAFAHPTGAASRLLLAAVNPELGAGYFLYTLFECYLVYSVVRSLTARDWPLAAVAGAFAATVLLPLPNILGIRDLAFILPFFMLGLLGAGQTFWERRPAILSSAFIYAATLALTYPTTVGGDRFWFAPLRSVLAGAGVHGRLANVWALSAAYHSMRYLCGAAGVVLLFAAYRRAAGWFLTPQAFIGRRSLGVYMSHVPIMASAFALGVHRALPLFLVSATAALGLTLVLERIPQIRGLLLGIWPRQSRRGDGALETIA